MSRVSIIIPVYNTEQWLSACLDSVLNQTLQDLEVICIDDCSPDHCGEILDQYAVRDNRVQVIHLPENHRQGYGRNRGLERASGTYVYFLDSDDTIVPEALEELTALADRDTLDAVFFDSQDIYENEELKQVYQPPFTLRKGTYRDEVYTGKDLLDDFIRLNEWTCYPQRILWRRQFILDEGIWYPEDTEHEDEYFAFAGILAAKRVRYIPRQYFNLRVRPDSVMTSGYAPKNFHGYLMNFWYMNRFIAERNLHTYGAEVNIARMYERTMTLYQALKDKYDLSEVFVRNLDKTLYSAFVSYFNTEYGEDTIHPDVINEIRKYRKVYIYGIGLTAERFCGKLERRKDILISGFLFKDVQNCPQVLMGRPVYKLDETDIPEDSIVVAAVKIVFWKETKDLLEKRNIKCIFHRNL